MTPIETIKAMCWLLAVLGIVLILLDRRNDNLLAENEELRLKDRKLRNILILQDRQNDKLLADNKKLREENQELRILVDFMKLAEEQERRKP